jgi:ADP-heptose:LPS heptosyltransferase
MIIISPYSKQMPDGKPNPKNYPFWPELVKLIDEPIIQIGIEGEDQLVPDFRKNLSIAELKDLLKKCRTWISCDSFFQHLAWSEKKQGIVLWSITDPIIFGHPENINLLKDRSYLSPKQFVWMNKQILNLDAFVSPEEVITNL